MQFELNANKTGGFSLRWKKGHIPNRDDRAGAIVWLKREIRRLQQVKNINYRDGNPGMPENEWSVAWRFQQANIEAMTVAAASLEAIERGEISDKKMKRIQSEFNTSQFDEDKPHYDPLEWEFDDLDYVTPTCNNKEIMKFHDHVFVEEIQTHYQLMNFAIHPDSQDVVMDLDNIVQVGESGKRRGRQQFQ